MQTVYCVETRRHGDVWNNPSEHKSFNDFADGVEVEDGPETRRIARIKSAFR